MTRTSCALILISLVGLASACSASKDEEILRSMGDVNPGEARVAGTVLHIDTTRSSRASDPCAHHPCTATIAVDSVLEYGSGFPRPLSAGEHINVRFAFTLSPTEEAMPGLEKAYGGLEEGVSFWADFRARPMPSPEGESSSFVIYDYYPR